MSVLSRRDFARFLAFSGTAALVPGAGAAQGFDSFAALSRELGPLPRTPLEPDEAFWQSVRARFLIPRDVGFLNAANLCPMSLPVVEAIEKNARSYELNPSPGRSVPAPARARGRAHDSWPRRSVSRRKRSCLPATRPKETTSSRVD